MEVIPKSLESTIIKLSTNKETKIQKYIRTTQQGLIHHAVEVIKKAKQALREMKVPDKDNEEISDTSEELRCWCNKLITEVCQTCLKPKCEKHQEQACEWCLLKQKRDNMREERTTIKSKWRQIIPRYHKTAEYMVKLKMNTLDHIIDNIGKCKTNEEVKRDLKRKKIISKSKW